MKATALLLCLVILLTMLTACAGEPTDNTTTTTTADSTVTTTTTAKFSGTTMTFAQGPQTVTTTTRTDRTTKPKDRPTEVNGVPVPGPAYDEGMVKLGLQDEFDSMNTFDFAAQGIAGKNWYLDSTYLPSTVTARDFTVKDGILQLRPVTTNEVSFTSYNKKRNNGYTWHFGYAEIRMKFPVDNIPTLSQGRDTWPSFWGVSVTDYMGKKWPASKLGSGFTESGELDMMEAWQLDNGKIVFSGALHHHVRRPGQTNMNGSNQNALSGDPAYQITNDWHVYSALWKPGYVAWYMDGKFLHSVMYGEGKPAVYESCLRPGGPYTPTLSTTNWEGVFDCLDNENLVIVFGGAGKSWSVDVDYIRIWEYED